MRIVVIGGLGNFGARICRRLAQEPGLDLLATSRRPAWGPAPVTTVTLDWHAATFAADLAALGPELVIHCAGPFQGQDYRVALASLACGAHYLDLADGREFVTGFTRAVGPAARAAGRLALTGASTLPALSSAVVDCLRQPLVALNSIDVVIAPGQRAPRGVATVGAVLGYAGQAFPWWQDGRWRIARGWRELRREQFSFGRRLSAACDVPDLELFPARYAGVRSVEFRAALEVACQHYGLWTIAAARQLGVPLPAARWAPSLNRLGTWLDRFGSDTGGMRVRVTGIDPAQRTVVRTWELVATGNHGPEIPTLAAVVLANRLRHGELSLTGAHVCLGMPALDEFEPEFARWSIRTRVVDDPAPTGGASGLTSLSVRREAPRTRDNPASPRAR